MVQSKEGQHSDNLVTDFILLNYNDVNKEDIIHKATGIYNNEEDAYAAAIVNQMQIIEQTSEEWPKDKISEKQEQITDLCQFLKESSTTYKERFEYMTKQCAQLFSGLYHTHYLVLPVQNNSNPSSQLINESIFKTEVRNFLDIFQIKSDLEEEDLGNSDDDEEDDDEDAEEDIGEDEELEDEEVDLEDDTGEDEEEEDDNEEESEDEVGASDDIEEEEEEEEDADEVDVDEEEAPTSSSTTILEASDGEETEEEEEQTNTLKRGTSALEDEEDEIDEDELEDEDELLKKRRIET
ncbi:MAG: hypothetical protein EXX96DRAFT_604591 [Benjaminiella poitrasii]|nr:MAG: hypothetical protein EXX96DRAFT_604591 [Benjaminiella poitrasii]